MIICIRTDSAEVTLTLAQPNGKIAQELTWEAGRQLSDHLLTKLTDLLQAAEIGWDEVTGMVVFRGPGSFTGLRIGATVANSVAYIKELPIVGTTGNDWLDQGCQRLAAGEDDRQVIPLYGSAPNITKPKK